MTVPNLAETWNRTGIGMMPAPTLPSKHHGPAHIQRHVVVTRLSPARQSSSDPWRARAVAEIVPERQG